VNSTLVRSIRMGTGRVGIELKQFFRDRESAVFNFLLPMILLVIFGSVFSGQDLGDSGITFSQYFVAGMIASGNSLHIIQNLAISIPMEREDGTLKRLQGTPLPSAAFFIGKIGMVFVAYIAQVTILIAVGVLLFGIDIPTTPLAIFTFTWVSILGLVTFTLLGIAYSVVPKQGRGAAALVTPVVLVLQFTSGVFFVFSDLPQWMQSSQPYFHSSGSPKQCVVFLARLRSRHGGKRLMGARHDSDCSRNLDCSRRFTCYILFPMDPRGETKIRPYAARRTRDPT